MDNQSSATMNLEQLQQLISSQVQQHTTPLHNQVRDLENTNQQLRTLVSQFLQMCKGLSLRQLT